VVRSESSTEIAELRRMVIRLSRLVENSVTLNSTLDLDRLLEIIIISATDLLESEAASILLVDKKTNDLYFAASTGSDPEEIKRMPVPLDGSIAGTIFRKAKPMIINDVKADPRHFRDVGERLNFEVRSLIGVPLHIREEVTGVLEAVNKRDGGYDESDLHTLMNIASQAAVAINNARLVEALQGAYNELGKLDRFKSEFIAIASHELRTPLGLILGYAALLKEETDQAAAQLAEMVLNSALRMRKLIEAMTNMNMLQVGTVEMDFKIQALQPVVSEAYEEVSTMIQTKGQRSEICLAEEPLYSYVDGPKLTLAIVNLLNNAMHFTPMGGRIDIELKQHGTEAWIQIRDNGAGIPEDQLTQIFEQFYQVDRHMTRRHGGLGLGLAIVRAIAQAHGGRVWADSDGSGKGSAFTIALPISN
jgi:signal transduction histidine kinase